MYGRWRRAKKKGFNKPAFRALEPQGSVHDVPRLLTKEARWKKREVGNVFFPCGVLSWAASIESQEDSPPLVTNSSPVLHACAKMREEERERLVCVGLFGVGYCCCVIVAVCGGFALLCA